jgi:TAG lipase/steryl ester hydrolase/phospholipase A2/LPA acyltransferase
VDVSNAAFDEPWLTLQEPGSKSSLLCRFTGWIWDIAALITILSVSFMDMLILHAPLHRWLAPSNSSLVQSALRRGQMRREHRRLVERLEQVDSFAMYYETAAQLDWLEGRTRWKTSLADVSQLYDRKALLRQLSLLSTLYRQGDMRRLLFSLRGCLTRDFCGIHRAELHQYCRVGTKRDVEDFVYVVAWLLRYIATEENTTVTWRERLDFFNQVRHAYGKSALLLSGGSTMGLSHFGVLQALHELKLLPRILSGASAGALVVAFAGVFTDNELFQCLESLQNPLTGRPIRFEIFDPSLSFYRAARRLAKRGVLFDIRRLQGCMRENLGDLTFQEAYDRTKRIINMTVTPAYGPPVLLNYLTAPNVLVWSAACASAALPIVFAPVELFAKDERGRLTPYHPEGFQWSDGSISSDIPLQRIGEMFNVNHFIVSQANPHFIPRGSLFMKSRLMRAMKEELKFRYTQLEGFGLVPRMLRTLFMVLTQPFEGHVTVLRDLRFADLGKLFRNPTVRDIRQAILRGRRLAYAKMDEIHHNCLIEFTIDDCIEYIGCRYEGYENVTAPVRSTQEAAGGGRLFPRVPSWLWADFGNFVASGSARSPPGSPKLRTDQRASRSSKRQQRRPAVETVLEPIADDGQEPVFGMDGDTRLLAVPNLTNRALDADTAIALRLGGTEAIASTEDQPTSGQQSPQQVSLEQLQSESADEDERVMC